MSDRKDILSELSEMGSPLGEIPFKPVFTVPEGYFDDFPSKMTDLIKKEENPDVQTELASISPLLASISKKPPFSVPEGYFDNLDTGVEKILDQKPAKLVKMNQPARFRVLYAAAGIAALLGLFSLLYMSSNNNSSADAQIANVNLNAELPKISATEISEYLSAIPDEIDTEPISLAGVEDADFNAIMDEIHESELEQFINDNPGIQEKNLN